MKRTSTLRGFGRVDANDLGALEDAEELRLRAERELGDLVHEHRSAVRILEMAGAVGLPKELDIEQVLRERGRFDARERPRRTARLAMNALGDDLFADAGFARDQDVDVAGRDELHQPLEPLHRRLVRARARRRDRGRVRGGRELARTRRRRAERRRACRSP